MASVRCPTVPLKENSCPGLITVPLIASAARRTLVLRFLFAVVFVVKELIVLYFSFALDADISGATVFPVAAIFASNFLSFNACKMSAASLS